MASKTYSKTCSSVGGFGYADNFKLYVKLEDTGEDIGDNTSKVKYSVYCQKPEDKGGSLNARHLKFFKLNGNEIENSTETVSVSGYPAKITIASGTTGAIKHSSDGTKSVSFSAQIKASSYGLSATINETFTLKKIPRYAKISSFSVSKRDETSVTFKWEADSTIDYVWYSKDNGSNWTGYNVTNGKSGSFNVSGLTANTKYNFKLRVRRDDSQLTTDSSTVAQTTYDYPKVTAITNFTIGSGAKVTVANPLKRTYKLEILQKDTNVSLGSYSGTYAGVVNNEFKTASAIESQYKSIKNSKSGTYYAKITYSGHTHTKGNATYSVKENEVPTFNAFSFSSDSHYNLTGDYNKVIIGYSNIKGIVPASDAATPNYYAEKISKYRMVIGSQSKEVTTTDTTMELTKVTSNKIDMYAIDSRGLSTTKSLSATAINYSKVRIVSLSAKRTNNVETGTTLSFTINFWNNNFGVVANSIKRIEYDYKKTYNQMWVAGETPITYSISGNTITGSLLIRGDLGDEGFDIENSYNIQLYVYDELSYHSYSTVLPTGLPAIAIKGNKAAIGKKYDTSQTQGFQVGTDTIIDKSLMVLGSLEAKSITTDFKKIIANALYPVGSIYITKSNSNPSSYLGGSWSLVDKGFTAKAYDLTSGSDFSINTTNCSKAEISIELGGNQVWLRIHIINKVEFAETALPVLTFKFENLPFNHFTHSISNGLGFSDEGNSALGFSCNYSTGVLTVTDAIPRGTANTMTKTGVDCYFYISQIFTKDNMKDADCDKFYWRRNS